jgi:hypothetical protein
VPKLKLLSLNKVEMKEIKDVIEVLLKEGIVNKNELSSFEILLNNNNLGLVEILSIYKIRNKNAIENNEYTLSGLYLKFIHNLEKDLNKIKFLRIVTIKGNSLLMKVFVDSDFKKVYGVFNIIENIT